MTPPSRASPGIKRLTALGGDFAEFLVAAHLPGEARALPLATVPELATSGAAVASARKPPRPRVAQHL